MKHLTKLCKQYEEQLDVFLSGTYEECNKAKHKMKVLKVKIQRNKLWSERVSDIRTLSILWFRDVTKSKRFS